MGLRSENALEMMIHFQRMIVSLSSPICFFKNWLRAISSSSRAKYVLQIAITAAAATFGPHLQKWNLLLKKRQVTITAAALELRVIELSLWGPKTWLAANPVLNKSLTDWTCSAWDDPIFQVSHCHQLYWHWSYHHQIQHGYWLNNDIFSMIFFLLLKKTIWLLVITWQCE